MNGVYVSTQQMPANKRTGRGQRRWCGRNPSVPSSMPPNVGQRQLRVTSNPCPSSGQMEPSREVQLKTHDYVRFMDQPGAALQPVL